VTPRTAVLTAGAAPCERVRVRRAWTTRALGTLLAVSCLLAGGCSSLPDETPTQPDSPQPVATGPTPEPATPPGNPVLGGPAPKASPTPTSEESPQPSPTPGSAEGASGCGSPLPPPLSSLNVKVHQRGAEAWTLDSTPLVGPDAAYCAKIGFTDGRSVCPVRPEGNAEREACELYVTGRATDTGRPGPTWSSATGPCTGRASGCENAENQYQLRIFQGGVFKACGRNGVCGEVQADR
jgi:hypothetical protein